MLRRLLALWATFAIGAAATCAFGPDSAPGCASDDDCPADTVCHAGACMGVTTGRSKPHESADAGDGG